MNVNCVRYIKKISYNLAIYLDYKRINIDIFPNIADIILLIKYAETLEYRSRIKNGTKNCSFNA